jgi:hypothetical protein
MLDLDRTSVESSLKRKLHRHIPPLISFAIYLCPNHPVNPFFKARICHPPIA